ncbi:MAG: T9SS type A sorting domain-containing protein [Bacteroidota bacterium]
MKQVLLLLAGAVALLHVPLPGTAQTFTWTVGDTSLSGPLGVEGVFEGTVTNISPDPLTLAFVRELNDLPQEWTSSLCLTVCFPPEVDSVLTTPQFGSTPLAPGETRSFSLHVLPLDSHGTGTMRLTVRDTRLPQNRVSFAFRFTSTTSSVGEEAGLPGSLALEEGYPNPFNASAVIGFRLEERTDARLAVYDPLGREAVLLLQRTLDPGFHHVVLEGEGLASGLYLVRLTAGNMSAVRKLLLLR